MTRSGPRNINRRDLLAAVTASAGAALTFGALDAGAAKRITRRCAPRPAGRCRASGLCPRSARSVWPPDVSLERQDAKIYTSAARTGCFSGRYPLM